MSDQSNDYRRQREVLGVVLGEPQPWCRCKLCYQRKLEIELAYRLAMEGDIRFRKQIRADDMNQEEEPLQVRSQDRLAA